jgi:hypothetical protein
VEGVIRVFSSSGTFLRMFGRKGDGPGEFRSPNGLGRFGDTVWVRDLLGRRYVLFDGQFNYLRTARVSGLSGYYYGMISTSESVRRSIGDSLHVEVNSSDGLVARQIPVNIRNTRHSFPIADPSRESGTRLVTSPLGSGTDVTLLPGGNDLILIEPASVWAGAPGQFMIKRQSLLTGRITDSAVVSRVPAPIGRRQADSIITEFVSNFPSNTQPLVRSRVELPQHFPPYRLWELTGDDMLWLRHYGDPDVRTVYSLRGQPLMEVRMPRQLRILAADRRFVWATMPDLDGLPVIIRFRIE